MCRRVSQHAVRDDGWFPVDLDVPLPSSHRPTSRYALAFLSAAICLADLFKEYALIDHVSLGSGRYAESVAFYRKVLAPLGLELLRDTGIEAAFGTSSHWSFFLYPVPKEEKVTALGTHVAFGAASRAAVLSTHSMALALSAKELSGPRDRPDISPTYFGAMFLDLDGHRVEVLTNGN